MTQITESHLFTAACLWEAALEACQRGEAEARNERVTGYHSFARGLHRYRANHGTAQLRDDVVRLAPACDAAWEALSDDEQDDAGSFDWDFVPAWLAQNFFNHN